MRLSMEKKKRLLLTAAMLCVNYVGVVGISKFLASSRSGPKGNGIAVYDLGFDFTARGFYVANDHSLCTLANTSITTVYSAYTDNGCDGLVDEVFDKHGKRPAVEQDNANYMKAIEKYDLIERIKAYYP